MPMLKEIPFLVSCGDPLQTLLNTKSLQVVFPLLKRVVPRSQEEGFGGEKRIWEGVGQRGKEKRKRAAQKKQETFQISII